MKKISEEVLITGKNSKNAFIEVSNKNKNGFCLFTIREKTFGNAEICIEYEAVDFFINKLKSLWKIHKKLILEERSYENKS